MRSIRLIQATVFLFLGSSSAFAQPYRDNLPIPSLEINRNLLSYVQAKDFEKISRTLPVIKSLTDVLKTKFGSDIESELRSALDSQDQGRVLNATQHLVYLDLKDLMNLSMEMMEESADKAKAKIRAAFLNYHLLSPFIQTANFAADQRIKKNFRTATLTLGVSAPYSGEKAVGSAAAGSQEEVKRLINEIDKDLATSLAFSK